MNGLPAIVFLSLGSNVGDKGKNLVDAMNHIRKLHETVLIQSSEIWKTEAWGNRNQDDFMNCAVKIETKLFAEELMEKLGAIEMKMGRTKTEKWGPRIIDIDILFYSDQILETKTLIIPHPEIQNRKFVLVPLNDICPEFIHPVLQKNILTLLAECNDKCDLFHLAK